MGKFRLFRSFPFIFIVFFAHKFLSCDLQQISCPIFLKRHDLKEEIILSSMIGDFCSHCEAISRILCRRVYQKASKQPLPLLALKGALCILETLSSYLYEGHATSSSLPRSALLSSRPGVGRAEATSWRRTSYSSRSTALRSRV